MPAHQTFFKRFLPVLFPLLLVIITVTICLANYKPGTWLTGWDTLHPEFNFGRNFHSIFFGVWREDQGLGTIAAHSHMSEFPRILMLWLFSWFMPLNAVKYVYIFSCFILGPLGIYFFVKHLLHKGNHELITNSAAFIAALLYIFNLGTVQHFYIIFEMFAVQYAALGWLFLLASQFYLTGKKKLAWWFFIASFLAAPMAYASLLWFAYALSMGLYLVTLFLIQKQSKTLNRLLIIGLLSVGANAFWLFPNLYFIVSGASAIPNQSHINELFSPEAFLHNQAYGSFSNLALLKNFLFNWLEYSNGSYQMLLTVWIKHLQLPFMFAIGSAAFIMAVTGSILTFIKRNNRQVVALLPVFALGIFMLINENIPFTPLFHWLRTHLSLFEEGLRFPFTKFSLVYMLALVSLAGYLLQSLLEKLHQKTATKPLIPLTIVILSVLLMWFGSPMFSGYLINPRMRNTIPEAYFKFFSWANQQPSQSRIAYLPAHTLFGWDHTNWGYEGPGFVWFGINQPVLVRDFDRWSPYNETFYNELSTAVYGFDKKALERVVTKYNVSLALLDESVIAPGQSEDTLRFPQLKDMLRSMGAQEVWSQDFLHVYDLSGIRESASFLYAPASYTVVETDDTYARTDTAYSENGPYISDTQNSQPIFYPFSQVYKDQSQDLAFDQNTFSLQYALRQPLSSYTAVIPAPQAGSKYSFPVILSYQQNRLVIDFQSPLELGTEHSSIALPTLEDIVIPISRESEALFLEIDEQSWELPHNQDPIQAQVSLPVGQAFEYSYFFKEDLQPDADSLTISTRNILTATTSAEIWTSVMTPAELVVNGDTKIVARVTSNPQTINPADLDSALNCDSFKRGSISTKRNAETESVTYQAKDQAAVCEGVAPLGIKTHQTYLLRVQNQNQTGRNLKVYLQNAATDRTDVEHLLPTNRQDVSYFIQSWPFIPESGYYVNWETRSFGSQPSINELGKVSFYPLNLEQLAGIKLIPNANVSPVSSPTTVTHTWKFGTHQYGGHVSSSTEDGVLVLSQGFDKAWLAFTIPANPLQLANYKTLEHVHYNTWANAWLLPKGESEVMIFYWPQLLSFIGYGLLGISVIALIYPMVASKDRIHEQ